MNDCKPNMHKLMQITLLYDCEQAFTVHLKWCNMKLSSLCFCTFSSNNQFSIAFSGCLGFQTELSPRRKNSSWAGLASAQTKRTWRITPSWYFMILQNSPATYTITHTIAWSLNWGLNHQNWDNIYHPLSIDGHCTIEIIPQDLRESSSIDKHMV